MSIDASVPVEEMERDELEARVRALEDRLDKLESKTDRVAKSSFPHTAFMMFLDQLLPEESIDDYGGAPHDYFEAVGEFASMVHQHESVVEEQRSAVDDPMGENWSKIVEAAKNLEGTAGHTRPNGYVALYGSDIVQATGHSERYALNLIEKFGQDDSKKGVTWQPHEPPQPSNNHSAKKKALLVDLDVWGN
ncbi:hypothetical protein ELS19_01330 [Halogeometricum borinquense]|uniref:Uncharacterized protein n=1 Tax=Halogeometricum borinquense TaxID=60847 RepID=A0A482T7Y7_9EURY|nr:hypothetical protein [Halogeometricum borinquense]RYJ12742.1 hypothetical protein ELS19_01330 [Halogeometricum borinquense]